MPGNTGLGVDNSIIAGGVHSNSDRETKKTQSGDQLIKTEYGVPKIDKDGIDFSNCSPAVKDLTLPINYVPDVKENKFFEKQAPQNEYKRQWKFKPIKRKNWKSFNTCSSVNNELNEIKNKSTVEEEIKDSPALDDDGHNYIKLIGENAKG